MSSKSHLQILVTGAILSIAASVPVSADDPNACDTSGDWPDVILGQLDAPLYLGTVDGIAAYSSGSTSCNAGTCWIDWLASTPAHPIFTQNLYRLEDGRFEQLGLGWFVHRFFALSMNTCGFGCLPGDGGHLGVGCSSPNSALSNAQQSNMGPRSDVNPSTGEFPYPSTGQPQTGNAIFKRLQVSNEDLDPALHPDAEYFIEGHTIAADDLAAGRAQNNLSYRAVSVAVNGADFVLLAKAPTEVGRPALEAWAEADAAVLLEAVDVPDDGRFRVASRATDRGAGRWSYEYAIHNLGSDRSAASLSVPLPAGAALSALGFHDVDYHSGEPYDGTDWAATIDTDSAPNAVVWATSSFADDPNANALRWGTLYNFRFEADAPPVAGEISIGLFKPGTPESIQAAAVVPQLCDGDGECEAGEIRCNCASDCGASPAAEQACSDGIDEDCDGAVDCLDADCCGGQTCPAEDGDADLSLDCQDCNDSDPSVWSTPGEVQGLVMQRTASAEATLEWEATSEPGALDVTYEALRSAIPAEFGAGADCLALPDPADTTAVDPELPGPGDLFAYLVRAVNACPGGVGPLGQSSGGVARSDVDCR